MGRASKILKNQREKRIELIKMVNSIDENATYIYAGNKVKGLDLKNFLKTKHNIN